MHTSLQALGEVCGRFFYYGKFLCLVGYLAFQSDNLGGLISLRFTLISLGSEFHPPSIKLRFVQAQLLGCRRYPKPLSQRQRLILEFL
jgi:hypothetical protein